MNIVLDSSFVLSLKNKDSNSSKARHLLKSLLDNDKVIIPAIVIAECLVSSSRVRDDSENLYSLSDNIEQTTESDYLFFQNIPLGKRKSLKANDCCILAICKRKKAKLLTFDSRLEKLAREYLN